MVSTLVRLHQISFILLLLFSQSSVRLSWKESFKEILFQVVNVSYISWFALLLFKKKRKINMYNFVARNKSANLEVCTHRVTKVMLLVAMNVESLVGWCCPVLDIHLAALNKDYLFSFYESFYLAYQYSTEMNPILSQKVSLTQAPSAVLHVSRNFCWI